jgi:hypothetical protein
VGFGGKDIGGVKPHIYYAMQAGATLTQAQNFGGNASSGYCYTGNGATADSATATLWAYYQSTAR